MSISVKNVNKSYATFQALKGVSFEAPSGGLTALLGPSGSGKTTLLRIVAGLERMDEGGDGAILFDGVPVTESPANRRQVGFVFQHYALFRHLTVFDNVAFGLKIKPRAQRLRRVEIAERVHELLKLVQLERLAQRLPAQLSGGQCQRVALARALAIQPRVLLLDEPFGALDAQVRKELRRWLRHLHESMHITTILVTHDQEEALEVADRIVVMNAGAIEQVGAPNEVFQNPINEFVMQFLGEVNVFHGRGHGETPPLADSAHAADAVRVLVRPHDLTVQLQPSGGITFSAVVQRVLLVGPLVKLELVCQGQMVLVHISHESYRVTPVSTGQSVYLVPRESRVYGDGGDLMEYVI